MKIRTLYFLGMVAILATAWQLPEAKCQTPDTSKTVVTEQPDQPWLNFIQGASDSKTIGAEVHIIYADGLPIGADGKKENPFGGGAGVAYPIGDYVYTYAGLNWFGGNWLGATGQIGLHADIHFGPVVLTPSVFAGSYTKLTGTGAGNDGDTGAILGTLLKAHIWQSKSGTASIDLIGGYSHVTSLPNTKFFTFGPAVTIHF